MREVVIVGTARTPIGEFNGTLASTSATVLGGIVIEEVIKRAQIAKEEVDEIIMGNVLPHGLGQNPARQAGFKAGLAFDTGAITVNKVCGSGLKAVMLAAQAIMCKDADIVVAGGMENMNLCPYYLPQARSGYRMGTAQMVDAMVHDGLWDINNDFHMGFTAELVSDKYGITREDMDRFSADSYRKALAAKESRKFVAEIVPVMIPQRKGDPIAFVEDESPRPTGLDVLQKLRPAFKKDGRVTAGNSSKISDGAAAVVVMAREIAEQKGLPIIARVGAQASAGLDPKEVLVAPIKAVPKVLAKSGLSIGDIDLFEVNEAFATSTVAVMRELKIPEEKLNVHGGAVALGHPIGASGARVLITLLHAMQDRDVHRGLATLCLGGGEAVALILERV